MYFINRTRKRYYFSDKRGIVVEGDKTIKMKVSAKDKKRAAIAKKTGASISKKKKHQIEREFEKNFIG